MSRLVLVVTVAMIIPVHLALPKHRAVISLLEAVPARYVDTAFGFSIQPPPGWKQVLADHFKVRFTPAKDGVSLGVTAAVVSPKQNTHEFLRQMAETMGVRIERVTPLAPQILRTFGAHEGITANFIGETKGSNATERFEEIWILRKKNRIYTIILDGDAEVRAKRREVIQKAVLSFRIH